VSQDKEIKKLLDEAGIPSSLKSAVDGRSSEVKREKAIEPNMIIRLRRIILGMAEIMLSEKKLKIKGDSVNKTTSSNKAISDANGKTNPTKVKGKEHKMDNKKPCFNKTKKDIDQKSRKVPTPHELLKMKIKILTEKYLKNKIHSSHIIDSDGKELLSLKIHDGKNMIQLLKEHEALRKKSKRKYYT
jgi:hypothetical protein